MADSNQVELIKSTVKIPMYFEKIIVPEMRDYYSDYTVNFDGRPVVKCPIHGEETPSMRYYEETNTFYCFGCRAAGDVINLHRLFTNVISDSMPSFDEAVDFMYRFFIQGIEDTEIKQNGKVVKREGTGELQLSTNSEMIRLSSYIEGLNDTLQFDTSISKEHKERIYATIDNVHLLSSLNIINAMAGLELIKSEVRNKSSSTLV